jgi:GntR family transcriptional repressor for pyruvate dehydrogenase complex
LREVIAIMELRTGIEVEAAGLAAERASPAQRRKIADCLEAIGEALQRGEDAIDQDFALHCAIADATGNPQFRALLEHLGRFIIPRQTFPGGPGLPRRVYSDTVQKEHRGIVQAIRNGAVAPARAAMRRHLLNSRKRYRAFAAKLDNA